MRSQGRGPAIARAAVSVLGSSLLLIVWVGVKSGLHISDRYLPSLTRVVEAAREIQPSIALHTLATASRIVMGMILGTVTAISLAITMCRFAIVRALLLPSVQALRAVPAVATVPFFLLWFGFSETGKVVMVLLGVALNILVAADQIIAGTPEKYRVALASLGYSVGQFPFSIVLPLMVDQLLPALRATAAVIFGVVIVSELLGSQLGLGYLIQTSYTTYSIHVIFLATIILGLLNIVFDSILQWTWSRICFWKSGEGARNT